MTLKKKQLSRCAPEFVIFMANIGVLLLFNIMNVSDINIWQAVLIKY